MSRTNYRKLISENLKQGKYGRKETHYLCLSITQLEALMDIAKEISKNAYGDIQEQSTIIIKCDTSEDYPEQLNLVRVI